MFRRRARLSDKSVKSCLVGTVGGAERGGGEPGAQDAVVGPGEEQGVTQAGVGDLVAVGLGCVLMRPWWRRRRRS
jgi:hypothetical protein